MLCRKFRIQSHVQSLIFRGQCGILRRCNGDADYGNDDDDDDEDNDVHAARSVWSRNLIPRLDQHSLPRSYTCPALTNDDDNDDDSGFDDFDDYYDFDFDDISLHR